ncbi:hypothetical protein GCM10009789_67090 [Kribbella sancticallisti]|uniref:Uncharacterized protein n=1 Tax=Kribbella sancticallisti TaxID=460087 RepID=A0ABP4QDK1_9ACTN
MEQGQALSDPWIPEHPFLERDEIIEQTPVYSARANVFVPARLGDCMSDTRTEFTAAESSISSQSSTSD